MNLIAAALPLSSVSDTVSVTHRLPRKTCTSKVVRSAAIVHYPLVLSSLPIERRMEGRGILARSHVLCVALHGGALYQDTHILSGLSFYIPRLKKVTRNFLPFEGLLGL